MNTIKADGLFCPVSSYLGGKLKSEWIPSHQTDVAKRFKAEIAKMRGERLDDYELTERDHHAAFIGGFK